MEARREFDIFKMKTIFSDCYNTLSKNSSPYHVESCFSIYLVIGRLRFIVLFVYVENILKLSQNSWMVCKLFQNVIFQLRSPYTSHNFFESYITPSYKILLKNTLEKGYSFFLVRGQVEWVFFCVREFCIRFFKIF